MRQPPNYLVWLLLAAGPAAVTAQQADLAVASSLPLTAAFDGFDGSLELLEDARLTPDLRKGLWGSGGPEMALDEKDTLLKEFRTVPLRPAVLHLVDAHRKIVFEKTLEREMASIQFAALHTGGRTILVTTDLSAGFGSYSGPSTELLEVNSGQLEPEMAREATSGAVEPVHLPETLKTAWKLVPTAAGQNGQKDILEVACRPDFDSKETNFFVIYTRYHWDGKGWTVFTRKVHGFWEADSSFPPPAQFPSGT